MKAGLEWRAGLLGAMVACLAAVAQSSTQPAPTTAPASQTQSVPAALPGSANFHVEHAPAPMANTLPASTEQRRQVELLEQRDMARRKGKSLPPPDHYFKDWKRMADRGGNVTPPASPKTLKPPKSAPPGPSQGGNWNGIP
jgi:hypothetical protein